MGNLYSVFLGIQYVSILLLILAMVYVIFQKPFQSQALMAVKFSYMGKPFIPLLMLCFIMDYCRVKMPRLLRLLLFATHLSIVFLVLTCQSNQLFYSKIAYTKEGIFPHLVLGHGIFYYGYTVLLVVYMILIPTVCIHRSRKCRDHIEYKRLVYLSTLSFLPIMGFVLFLTGLTKGYDTTAFSFVLSTVLLLITIFRYNLFDTLRFAKDYVIDNLADGFVVLNNEDELLFTNEPAKDLYKELATASSEGAVKQIKALFEQHRHLHHNENVYEVSCQEIFINNVSRGKLYILNNVTDNYNYTKRLRHDVKEKTKEIAHIQHSVIASFADMVEARDGITGQHIKNTSAYVKIIANALKDACEFDDVMNDEFILNVIDAAPLHDIGKIAIPDAILTKPGRLDYDEFEIIKTHPQVGAKIIEDTLSEVEGNEYLKVARDMAHYHHERWDGTGYPDGLKGEEIPLCARIMAVADVYDALCSKRSYKEAYSKEKARNIILESAGSHFDPEIVKIFMKSIKQIEHVSL